MTNTTKALLVLIGLLVLSSIGFIAYQQYAFNRQSKEIQNSVIDLKRLSNDVIRSQSQFVNQKGFDDFIKQNNVNIDAIQRDISSLGGQISGINVITTNSTSQVKYGVSSTTTTATNSPNTTTINCDGKDISCTNDQFNYFGTIQKLELNEDFGKILVPIGAVQFDAGTSTNKPWGFEIFQREYKISNTIAHTIDGQTVIYNAVSIKVGDKYYSIPISNSSTVEKYPLNSFSWFNPKLALGISGGINFSGNDIKFNLIPSLSASIMSYGKMKNDPSIRFLSIGGGLDFVSKKPTFEISPIQFNVGKAISGNIVNNTWIAPVVGINTEAAISVGLGVQVGL